MGVEDADEGVTVVILEARHALGPQVLAELSCESESESAKSNHRVGRGEGGGSGQGVLQRVVRRVHEPRVHDVAVLQLVVTVVAVAWAVNLSALCWRPLPKAFRMSWSPCALATPRPPSEAREWCNEWSEMT